uniref:SAM domain-containing protein n=1 Tax=Xiphophorus couchianus TaxID=32473 RepID=A0A3B5KSX3_9TELE
RLLRWREAVASNCENFLPPEGREEQRRGQQSRNKQKTSLETLVRGEIEAKEACTWLRAAGFPQYAQLYEDSQFPIDISSVTRDHDFLDRDAIEALCRRLNTLNKCALMRLEISPQRKRVKKRKGAQSEGK